MQHPGILLSIRAGLQLDLALRNRIEAMKEAIADEKDYQDFLVDFLDRDRVATWLRSHPYLILWVEKKSAGNYPVGGPTKIGQMHQGE